MDRRAVKDVASHFAEYIERLSEVMGHADRHGPLAPLSRSVRRRLLFSPTSP